MFPLKLLASALLSAMAWAADSPVLGKWGCTNTPDTGPQSAWTLVMREDGEKLAGFLTDGEVEVALSDIKFDNGTLTFQFDVNAKAYGFKGTVQGKALEGRFKGEEASGRLSCEKTKTS